MNHLYSTEKLKKPFVIYGLPKQLSTVLVSLLLGRPVQCSSCFISASNELAVMFVTFPPNASFDTFRHSNKTRH